VTSHYLTILAVRDIERMQDLSSDGVGLSINLYRALEADDRTLGLKLIHLGAPLSLSDVLPMMENMGLKVENEMPSGIRPEDGPRIWIHDFGLELRAPLGDELERLRPIFDWYCLTTSQRSQPPCRERNV